MNLSNTLVDQVTGLPVQAPDPPKETKLGREQAAKEYCETTQDTSKSGIRLEGLKNPVYRKVAQLMALKLFGLQRPTHVPIHLLAAIIRVVHNCPKEEMLQLSTWTEGISDDFIKLDYEDHWKMFEDGLPKEECRMENHELWWPTFTANTMAKVENKVAEVQAKTDFIYDFMDIWVRDIKETDLEYQLFLDRFGQTIPEEMRV
eukprot:Gb_19127 [translate_table: standard]